MIKPLLPANENARIRSLLGLRILDTSPEAAYNQIAQLASVIADTPVALISLVDENRQWFKAKVGLDAPETPRDISFCGHVVANGQLLEVGDATKDPRFHDNPFVTGELGLRFYIGAPIQTAEGHILGTVCAIDTKPRQLTDQQRAGLKALAQHVSTLFELRRERDESTLMALSLQETVDELQSNRAKLMNASRLAALGEMASGVAHEVNNPLAILIGSLDRIESSGASKIGDNADAVGRIKRAADRIRLVVQALLDFSSLGKADERLASEDVRCDFQVAIEKASLLQASRAAAAGVKIHFDFTKVPKETWVCADEREIMLTMQVLVSNAIDASVAAERTSIEIAARIEGRNLFLTIKDFGGGISPTHTAKIFEPFFSTKPLGHGRGLGLSSALGVMERRQGSLRLISNGAIGGGPTMFEARWPLVEFEEISLTQSA